MNKKKIEKKITKIMLSKEIKKLIIRVINLCKRIMLYFIAELFNKNKIAYFGEEDISKIIDFVNENTSVQFSHIETIPCNGDKICKWVGGVRYDHYLYGIANCASNVMKYDINQNEISYIGSLENDDFKWTGGCIYKNKIYGFLRSSNNLLCVDPIDNTVDQIELGLKYVGEHHYGGVVTKTGIIYQPPRNTDHILVIDLNSYTTRKIMLNPTKFNINFRYCGSVLHSNGLIYFLPERDEKVLVLDPVSEKFEFIGKRLNAMVFDAAIACDNNIYGFSAYAKGILKIDTKTKKTGILCKDIGIPGCFGTKLGVDGQLYGIPGDGNAFYQFNPKDCRVKVMATTEEKGKAKCAGGIIDKDGSIICVPSMGSFVYKLKMIGFPDKIPDDLYETPFYTDNY